MGTLKRESVIVVSDVHLGHRRSNFRQFNDFLDWIGAAGEEREKSSRLAVTFNSQKRKIRNPDMMLFLGDLLELWEPKNDDIGNVGKQSKKLLEKIIELPFEKIYVLGNHDKSLEEFRAQTYDLPRGNFEIYYRHFPENAESEYLTVGDLRYFFIHGHQFDKDMRYFRKLGEVGPSILLSLQKINKQLFRGRGFGSLLPAAVLWCLDFWLDLWKFENIAPYVVSFLLPLWGTNLLWRAGRPFARKLFKARHRDIESIIKKGWYDLAKDTIAAENLVFAHTHCPGIEKVEMTEELVKKKQVFINSGSWFEEEEITNTFIHIGEKEILLLKWEKDNPKILMSYNTESKEIEYSNEMADFVSI